MLTTTIQRYAPGTGYWSEGRIDPATNTNVGGAWVSTPVPTPAPAPTIAPPVITPTPVIARSPSLLDTAREGAYTAATSMADARAQADSYAAQQRQARIDAINQTFAPRIAREQKAGEDRLSRVAAINFKSGIVGSGVDTTKTGEQTKLNESAIQAIEDTKATAINEAFGWADQLARQRAEDIYKEATLGAEAKVKLYQDRADTAMKALDSFGSGGVSLETLKLSDPNTYQTLRDVSGMSDLQIASYLNSKSPAPENVSTKIENGYIISSYFDPRLKKFTTYTEKLPEGVSTNKDDLAIAQGDNGIIYAIDKKTGKVVNNINAAKGTGTTEPTNFTDIMQQSIDTGATPEQAAREAALVSEQSGIQVSQETLSEWTKQAKKMEKTPVEVPEVTPVIKSKLEQDIEQLSSSGILEKGDIRYALRQRGYSEKEINTSSISNIIDKIGSVSSSFFSNLFGG